MTTLEDRRAILSVDPSKRGLAFMFFLKGQPADWGHWRTAPGRDEIAVFRRILRTCPAEVVVLEDPRAFGCQRSPRIRRALGALAAEAETNGVEVAFVARQRVRDQWANDQGLTRKDAVAAAIGETYPVLRPLVPKFRKIFMDEEPRSRIFDAASLAIYACGADRSGEHAA